MQVLLVLLTLPSPAMPPALPLSPAMPHASQSSLATPPASPVSLVTLHAWPLCPGMPHAWPASPAMLPASRHAAPVLSLAARSAASFAVEPGFAGTRKEFERGGFLGSSV